MQPSSTTIGHHRHQKHPLKTTLTLPYSCQSRYLKEDGGTLWSGKKETKDGGNKAEEGDVTEETKGEEGMM